MAPSSSSVQCVEQFLQRAIPFYTLVPRSAMWVASVSRTARARVCATCNISLKVLDIVGVLVVGAGQFTDCVS